MRPFSLRLRLMLMLALAVTLPVVGSGYVLIHRAEQALITEKESKLFGIAHTLDSALPGTFDDVLSAETKLASRDQKVHLLNSRLADITDQIVNGYPGVGAGYYSKDLDGIITYGPSPEYNATIGQSIAPDHMGRTVMLQQQPMVVKGQMVRGNILNAMVPLIRQGRVIGYVWANELTQSVDRQIQTMEEVMYLALLVALILGLGIAMPLAHGVSSSVQRIIRGLRRLRLDLTHRLPRIHGEFGEITTAINEMAQSIMNTRSHTEIIMESMVDGIITIDNDGKVTALNQATCQITGLNKEVIGQNYAQLFPEHVDFHSLLLETLHTGRNFIGYEVDFQRVDGGSVPISVSTSMLYNQEDILGAVIVFKDLTEPKAFEDRVRRVDHLAAVGELAAGVAHEIRNPLAAISGSVQILVDELPEDHASRVFGDVVLKEVYRLNAIIEDLLYFAKPSKNYISRVHPNKLIHETLALLSPSFKKDVVKLEEHLDPTLGLLSVDAGLIKQVLVNLLLNALQALPPEGGKISVFTRLGVGGVEIIIQDTGIGIFPEHFHRIFDPFFTIKDRGTGLGLAVSNKIIEIHHGYIHVESIVGIGSTFTIYLPYESES